VTAAGADERAGLAPQQTVGGLPEIHRHLGEPGEVIARSATMRSADAARDARGFGTGWSDGPLPMPASYPVQPELTTCPDEPDARRLLRVRPLPPGPRRTTSSW
jgi:hypothetical protein